MLPSWIDVRETSAPRWPARRGPRASGPDDGSGHALRLVLLALLVVGSGVGLWLWGKWGFLIAFDAVMAYCF